MANQTFNVSIRADMQNKAGEEDRKRTGDGWTNVELSLDDFIHHIRSGFPFTHQFIDGRRKKDFFAGTNVLIADIDNGLTVGDAIQHQLILNHAAFIYTTPSHTEEHHRFRVVFHLERELFDGKSYEALYDALMDEIPTDPATRSCAQFFFGNTTGKIYPIGRSLDHKTISKMIARGLEKSGKQQPQPLLLEKLTADTLVRVRGQPLRLLGSLPEGASIQCPFGVHADKHPSAFVKINRDGTRGVQCRSCGNSAWTEPLHKRDDGFDYFDRMVMRFNGAANSHFEYQGLTRFDHDLEVSKEKSNYHLLNSEKLGDIPILPGVTLIKSPKGSGKTHSLAKLVENFKNPDLRKRFGLKADDRIILVGHRQSLIRESAAKLGLECYLDTGDTDTKTLVEGGKYKTHKPPNYAICLDSLHTRIRPRNEKYGVLIIDESEQVFSHFFSEHMKYPERNFAILSGIMKQAKYVYCLDADLDNITLSGVISCLSKPLSEITTGESRDLKRLYCFLNTYQPERRKIEVYTGKNHLLDDLRLSIKSGKRCYVVSNSKKQIEGLYGSFSKVFSKKKFRMIVSNEGDDNSDRLFLKNIKTEILNYDAVLSSPAIGTGIDITFPNNEMKIDCVYGIFEGGINTHFDIDQQLGRVRHPGEVKVWVHSASARMSLDRRRIIQELLNDEHIAGLRYYLDHEGGHSSGEHPFSELLTEVLVVRRRSMNRLKDNFIEHKKRTGWDVALVAQDEIQKEKGSLINKAGKNEQRRRMVRRILGADNIGFEEAFRIKGMREKNQPLTEKQKASEKKYYLKDFYKEEVSEKLILLDDDGKTREKIDLLDILIDPLLTVMNNSEFRNSTQALLNFRGGKISDKKIEKVVFLREALLSAGLFDPATCSLGLGATYSTNTLSQFTQFMKMNEERYQRLFNKEIHQDLANRPITQLRSVLRLLGLEQEVSKRNRGGNKGDATYQLKSQSFNALHKIIMRRREEWLRSSTTTQ